MVGWVLTSRWLAAKGWETEPERSPVGRLIPGLNTAPAAR